MSALDLEPNFVVDKAIESAMKTLSLYFSGDPEFENFGFGKFGKGLFLIGNIGVGKTLLMKAFAKAMNNFIVVSVNRANDDYQLHGIEGIEKYVALKYEMGGARKPYCFDDIGVEANQIKHMGNELKVMERIILDRYENRQITFFTSNLGGDDIEKIYGTRIRSRLREMCNYIVIPGTDRRK
jgi:DNA replication protein DnaC